VARPVRGLYADWGRDPIQRAPVAVDPSGTVILMTADSLKEQIENGEYRVDPGAVAEAILRRAQNVCSYPASGPWASRNTTPAGPSTTDPITVRSLLAVLGGTQAHSS
jgi:hypothetical protein